MTDRRCCEGSINPGSGPDCGPWCVDADFDPLALPAAYFEGLPTGVRHNLPSQPEPVEIPDLDDYSEASIPHAEGHYAVATDPELCDDDDCPHWPSWWTDRTAAGPADQ